MKNIVAISDTHNLHTKLTLPDGDILIHSGDATGRGRHSEITAFLDWFGSQSHEHKVFVPGNHDWGFAENPELYKQECADRNIHLLINEGLIIKYDNEPDIKIWGSPATPWFHSWAFNYSRTLEEATTKHPWIKNIWDNIDPETNILVTHGPPMGILDELVNIMGNPTGKHVGCEELKLAIDRVKPDVHIFGHIHCGYGEKHIDGVSHYNASICGETYAVDHVPHVIPY